MNSSLKKSVLNDAVYKKLLNEISLKLNVTKESINGYNINTVITDGKSKIYNSFFISFIFYLFSPFALFFCLIVSKFKQNKSSDVTFEIWRKDSLEDYYEDIIEKVKIKYLINKYESYKYNQMNFNKPKIIKILFLILFNLKILSRSFILSRKYKINFFFLILKLFYAYLKYSSEAKYLNTKMIVSALDFGYHILRYELFKKEGISVTLIQSSMRTKSLLRYKAGDTVFVFGELQKKLYTTNENQFDSVITVGSIKNQNCLNRNYEKEFDIMFVEQYYDFDTLPYASNKNYELLLSYLVRFSEENPSYNIIYRTREEKRKKSSLFSESLKKIDESNIIVDSKGDSYEKVAKSRIVIGYSSALCFEAIGLNTKTIFYYYDNYKFELFDYEKSNEDILVTSVGYKIFSKSLKNLINNAALDTYFKKYKQIYMNQDNNISITISNYIKEHLA